MSQLLTPREVAQRLSISVRQVRRLSSRDGFPEWIYLSDRCPRIFEDDLKEYVEKLRSKK